MGYEGKTCKKGLAPRACPPISSTRIYKFSEKQNQIPGIDEKLKEARGF